MKLTFLKSLLALKIDPEQIKKYILVLNFCVFLSIFALISSSISIYYQNKVNNNDKQKLELATNRKFIKNITAFLNRYENFFNNVLVSFRYDRNFSDLVADNSQFEQAPARSRERFFINVKNFSMYREPLQEDIESLSDIVEIFSDVMKYKAFAKEDFDLLIEYKKVLQTDLNFITNLTDKDLKFFYKEFVSIEDKKHISKKRIYYAEAKEKLETFEKKGKFFFKRVSNIDYNKYSEASKKVESFLINYQLTLLTLNKILLDLDTFFIKLEKDIDRQNAKLSSQMSKAILIAFVLQFLTFVFTNFFEVSTYKDELAEDEEKNS